MCQSVYHLTRVAEGRYAASNSPLRIKLFRKMLPMGIMTIHRCALNEESQKKPDSPEFGRNEPIFVLDTA